MSIELLHDLIIIRENNRIIVIVPAQDVLLTSVSIPKLNRKQLLQALPFALEDQLIDDVANLHFAINHRDVDGNVSVAIVSKQKMQHWLALLKEVNVTPTALIPATLAIPYQSDEWTVCLRDHESWVRTGLYSGFFCETDNVSALLQLQLANTSAPKQLTLYRFSEKSFAMDALHVNDIQPKPDDFLPWLMTAYQDNTDINLLQAPYEIQSTLPTGKKLQKTLGFLAVSCVSLLLVSHIISWVILQHAENRTQQQINLIYKKHFPEAKNIVAPRERLADKLKRFSSPVNQQDFLFLLSIVSAHLKKSSDIHIQQMDYHDKVLSLKVTAATFDSLDALTEGLKQQHIHVKQQSTTHAESQINATLFISRGAV